ncbi:LOW QUALITY PROTEIN: uncharacterized protein [Procambarus clarkii]|uniref:LOW QUALITY PROTEIN: uncharacterized protein n=1 Tax=Procambarus clarkii TaxID=6728 RepID=UPI003743B07D
MMSPASLNPHQGYSAQDINFGRLFKAATQTSKRLLKEVFVIMMNRSHVSATDKYPITVADYCFNVLLWSNAKYRENFNAEERLLMEQDLSSADFDVSLLTKMIHKLFSFMTFPEPFSSAIRDLKHIRNRVCHKYSLVDNTQLRANFDDLKIIFVRLLNEAADFLSIEIRDLRNIFLHEADEILYSTVMTEASNYLENLEQFRGDLVGRFIIKSRPEVMEQYSKLKSLNPFTWLSDEQFPDLLVDKIFTPLQINEQSRIIEVDSLLATKLLSLETQETSGILPSVLVLSGIAGCGKTSLCRYLLHNWSARLGVITALRAIDLIIHIELRNVTCNTLVSHLRRSLLNKTCKSFEEKDIIEILQEINVLFIIDGMDEATTDGRQLVNEVLSVIGNSRVIITTRPEFTLSVVQVAERYHLSHMELYVHGFSEQGMTKFTSNVFISLEANEKKRRQQECGFLKMLQTSGKNLGDHLKLPLTLAMLICLWRDDEARLSHVTSATRLYYEIFRMCTSKMISRLQARTSLHPMELEAFAEEWLMKLGKEAFEMLDNREFLISHDRRRVLASFCSERHIDSIQVFSAFLVCEVNNSMKGTQYHFSFIHKSQMEYLAAFYLARELKLKGESAVQRIISVLENLKLHKLSMQVNRMLAQTLNSSMLSSMKAHSWSNTLMFTIGHLCRIKASDLVIYEVTKIVLGLCSHSYSPTSLCQISLEPQCHPLSSFWQVAVESNCHPLVCKMIYHVSNTKIMWRPSAEALYDPAHSLFQLLHHTNFRLHGVLIRIITSIFSINVLEENGLVDMKSYENLVPLLSYLASQPSTKVALRLDQQYYSWGDPETADDLLTTLLPKGNLTAVMCHLGALGAAALACVRKIGKICIRVSDLSTLIVVRNSLSTIRRNVDHVTLRLDIPPTVLPSSLPTFKQPLVLSIILREVDDSHVDWASEAITRLSTSYKDIDLVASRLTPSGGEAFLKALRNKQVNILDQLTIRSTHRLEESHYQEMSQMIQCHFSWWY